MTAPDPAAALLSGSTAARVLVVVAHPDDEVLGCGALLVRLRDPIVVHVTDGAPRNLADAHRHGFGSAQAYADARASEAEAALALAGVAAGNRRRLGFGDQDAAHHLVAMTAALKESVAAAGLVLTHAYEGGHPDHDAVAFAVHAAVRLRAPGRRPAIVEMPFYHAGPDGWTRQSFLPHGDAGPERQLRLSPGERALKARMVAAHATQAGTLAGFAIEVERYRAAPRYDFTRLPHGGDLLYERHGWNLTGPVWLDRTRAALSHLGLAP